MKKLTAILLMAGLVLGCASIASAADYRLIYDESNPSILVGYAGKLTPEVALPEGITHIDENAFKGNKELEILYLPDSLRTIGSLGKPSWSIQGAFEGCSSLREVHCGKALEEIGDRTFYNCSRLESISFNSALKKNRSFRI